MAQKKTATTQELKTVWVVNWETKTPMALKRTEKELSELQKIFGSTMQMFSSKEEAQQELDRQMDEFFVISPLDGRIIPLCRKNRYTLEKILHGDVHSFRKFSDAEAYVKSAKTQVGALVTSLDTILDLDGVSMQGSKVNCDVHYLHAIQNITRHQVLLERIQDKAPTMVIQMSDI